MTSGFVLRWPLSRHYGNLCKLVPMSANADTIGMPVGELETPALCLDLEAYRRNLRRMADYIIQTHGLAWRPHMKGQKASELAREAVAAGATGVTCATLYEAEVMVDSG